MKRILYIFICIIFSSVAAWAQDYQQAFVNVQQEFEQRLPGCLDHLQQYLVDYPYTTYSDEVQLMIGVLATEKGNYKQASKVLEKVNRKNLSRQAEPMWYFNRVITIIVGTEPRISANRSMNRSILPPK